jgi:hypothetical protein
MLSESEHKIRSLSRKVIETNQDSPEFSPAVHDLKTAIREHVDGVREKVTELAAVVANENKPKAA